MDPNTRRLVQLTLDEDDDGDDGYVTCEANVRPSPVVEKITVTAHKFS